MIGLNCSRDAIVPARGLTLPAHSVRPMKMPGWIVTVGEIFCTQPHILVGFLSCPVKVVVNEALNIRFVVPVAVTVQ